MPTETVLPPEVQIEAGPIVSDLHAAGWKVTAARYDEQAFGNWFVDLQREGLTIRIIKDRSQFMVEGPIDDLKAAGLFKAFDGASQFREAVAAWAARPWA